jgi:chromate reductase
VHTPVSGRALRVVGIVGSLRAASYNRGLLLAAQQVAPREMVIQLEDLTTIPLFNQDTATNEVPAAVSQLRNAVQGADGLLLATPEYNHGVPGVLKNAIDWLSQPPRACVLEGRPTAIMGASTGFSGTARGQMQLRQSFVLTDTPVMQQPELLVNYAREKFDASGALTDDSTRQLLTRFLARFAAWVRHHQGWLPPR